MCGCGAKVCTLGRAPPPPFHSETGIFTLNVIIVFIVHFPHVHLFHFSSFQLQQGEGGGAAGSEERVFVGGGGGRPGGGREDGPDVPQVNRFIYEDLY